MKTDLRHGMAGGSPTSANEQVRSEIQSFLRALDSYPERFALSPGISFEEHLGSLVEASEPAPRRRMLNPR